MGMFSEETGNKGGNGNGNNSRNQDFEKAKGFANLYLPTPNGGRVKLGSIPLRESVKGEKAALDFLMAAENENDLNERIAKILKNLQFEFTPVTDKAVELALG